MLLLARSGQRHMALSEYETCQRLLMDELGVEPAPETTALFEAIRSGTLAAALTTPPAALKASPTIPNHLPASLTPFIGRKTELVELTAQLDDPTCRLLTLVGPGGIGKTRLAQQAAVEHSGAFKHGAHFVDLTRVNSADLLPTAIGSVLEIAFYGEGEAGEQLLRYLRDKQMLLVLDNFEHLLSEANLLSDWLIGAPHLKILVTSRERLNLQEEWVLPVPGLRFPTNGQTHPVESYSAVQLFAQHARRFLPHFSLTKEADAVVKVCQAVDGMPLGIELAASWIRVMACDQIANQIRNHVDFLTTPLRNTPERHRSMRVVF